MPKVRARHRGDALATATGERAPSPATSRSRAAIYALERLELRSPRSFRRVRGASIPSAFSGTPRENRDPRGKCFRRFGDRAPRRARRPPRRATRPLSSAGTDIIRSRPRRNAAEANPRASPSRCSAPTSTCPSTTSRGRYGRDARPSRRSDRRISRAVSTVETRGRRLTVAPPKFPSRGFQPFFFFFFGFVSAPTRRTETDRRLATKTRKRSSGCA